MIDQNSALWNYLSPQQRQLAVDGNYLVEDQRLHPDERLSDYSFLVFPFAKLMEGFLKQLLLDLHIISERDYLSDHFRIGRALSPTLGRRYGKENAYLIIERRYGKTIATKLWHTWKQGRNLIFHYYPHNYKAVDISEAHQLIGLIVDTLNEAVITTKVKREKYKSDTMYVGRFNYRQLADQAK